MYPNTLTTLFYYVRALNAKEGDTGSTIVLKCVTGRRKHFPEMVCDYDLCSMLALFAHLLRLCSLFFVFRCAYVCACLVFAARRRAAHTRLSLP